MHEFQYIKISKGHYFGVIDIIGSILSFEVDCECGEFMETWYENVEHLTRQFNLATGAVQAELLTLSIEQVWKMKSEYFDQY